MKEKQRRRRRRRKRMKCEGYQKREQKEN